jgi:uncharacterized protein YbaP (TraB family)
MRPIRLSFFRASVLIAALSGVPASAQLLWEISGNGMERPSYLFGTVHLQERKVFGLNEHLFEKMGDCVVYAGELDLDDANRRTASEFLFLPEGTFLEQLYSGDDYARLSEKFRSLTGLDITLFHGFKPVGLLLYFVQSFYSRDATISLDEFLRSRAVEHGLQPAGLETVGEQVSLMERITPAEVLRFFDEADPAMMEKQSEETLDLWLRGDIEGMIRLADQQTGFDPFDRRSLIDERNVRLADRLDGIMRERPVFCAVGAGHLGGTNGMVALLRKAGYLLRPVEGEKKDFFPADSGTEGDDTGWIRSGDEDGEWSCLWPAEPDMTPGKLRTPMGDLDVVTWTSEEPGLTLSLSRSEYPEETVAMLGEANLYESALDMAVKSINGRLDSSEETVVAGRKGRQARILFDQGRSALTIRMLFDKGRIFVLQAVTPAGNDGGDVRKFLDSFELE